MSTSLVVPHSKETWSDGNPIYPAILTIEPTAGDFTGSYASGVNGYDRIWIRQATASNGTIGIPIPHLTIDGITLLRMNDSDIEISQAGDHDWTGYTMDIFMEYTLADLDFFEEAYRYSHIIEIIELEAGPRFHGR